MLNKEKYYVLEKTTQYIEDKIKNEERFTNKDIAKYVGYDEQYLSKIFKEQFNVTIQEYFVKRKMYLASNDLLKTDELIRTIASKYGYSEDGFIKAFKKFNKITPKQFRKERKERNMFIETNITEYIEELNDFFEIESYEIKEKNEIKVIGLIETSEFSSSDFGLKCMFLENKLEEELGECFCNNFIELTRFKENYFEYMYATLYNEFDIYSKKLNIKILPKQKWLIIKGKSFSKEYAINYSKAYGLRIVLPNLKEYKENQNSYILAFSKYNFEKYIEYNEQYKEAEVEVWIPIIEK